MATQAISPASAGVQSDFGLPSVASSSNAQVVWRASAGSNALFGKPFVLPEQVTFYGLEPLDGCPPPVLQHTFGGTPLIAGRAGEQTRFGGTSVHNYDQYVFAPGVESLAITRVLASEPLPAPVPMAPVCGQSFFELALGQPASDQIRRYPAGGEYTEFGSPLFRVVQFVDLGGFDLQTFGRTLVSRELVSVNLTVAECQRLPVQLTFGGPYAVGAGAGDTSTLGQPRVDNYRTYVALGVGETLGQGRTLASGVTYSLPILKIDCAGATVQANLSGVLGAAPLGIDFLDIGAPELTGGAAGSVGASPTGLDYSGVGTPLLSLVAHAQTTIPLELGTAWASYYLRELLPTPLPSLSVGQHRVENWQRYVVPAGQAYTVNGQTTVYERLLGAGEQTGYGSVAVALQYQLASVDGEDFLSVGVHSAFDPRQEILAYHPLEIGLVTGSSRVYLRTQEVMVSAGETLSAGALIIKRLNVEVTPDGTDVHIIGQVTVGRNPNQILFPQTDPFTPGDTTVDLWVKYVRPSGLTGQLSPRGPVVWKYLTFVPLQGVASAEFGSVSVFRSPKVKLAPGELLELGSVSVGRTPLQLTPWTGETFSMGSAFISHLHRTYTLSAESQLRLPLPTVVESWNLVTQLPWPWPATEYGLATVHEQAILPTGQLWNAVAQRPLVWNLNQIVQLGAFQASLFGVHEVKLQTIFPRSIAPMTEFGDALVWLYEDRPVPITTPVGGLEMTLFGSNLLANALQTIAPGVGELTDYGGATVDFQGATGLSLYRTSIIGDVRVTADQILEVFDTASARFDMLEVGSIAISPWIVYARPDIPDPPPYGGTWEPLELPEISRPLVAHRVRTVQPLNQTYNDLEPFWERFGTPSVWEINSPQVIEVGAGSQTDIWFIHRVLGGIMEFDLPPPEDFFVAGKPTVAPPADSEQAVLPDGRDMLRVGQAYPDNFHRPVPVPPVSMEEYGLPWVSFTPIPVYPDVGETLEGAAPLMVDFRVRTFELSADDTSEVKNWSPWPPTETRVSKGEPYVLLYDRGIGDTLEVGLHLIGRTTLCAQQTGNSGLGIEA